MINGMPYARGDTAEHAEREQIRSLASLSPSHRLALAVALSDVARDLALCGLRAREPSLGESEITRRFLEAIRGWRIEPPRASSPAA
jgi:hypothetical protein